MRKPGTAHGGSGKLFFGGTFMQKLLTEAGTSMAGIPWNVYPRPQMVRKD